MTKHSTVDMQKIGLYQISTFLEVALQRLADTLEAEAEEEVNIKDNI